MYVCSSKQIIIVNNYNLLGHAVYRHFSIISENGNFIDN